MGIRVKGQISTLPRYNGIAGKPLIKLQAGKTSLLRDRKPAHGCWRSPLPSWKGAVPICLLGGGERCLAGTREVKSLTAMLTNLWSPCESILKPHSAQAPQRSISEASSWKEECKGCYTKKLHFYKKVHADSIQNCIKFSVALPG